MTDGKFLHYDGPAAIDGTDFPSVSLREHREQGGLFSWNGSATMAVGQAPAGFTPELATDAVLVELPDGRHGKALVTNILFNGQGWQMELTGTGPAPGYPQQ